LKTLSFGFVFASVGPAINMLLRAEGKIKDAMKILSVGVFLNITLDFIFIYIFKMGVSGAALATIISQMVILGLNLIYIKQGKSIISFKQSKLNISRSLLRQILGIGSASMILLLMASLQQIFLFKTLAIYDNPALIPLLGAAYRILLFAVIPFAGLGQGLQSIAGINYGAGNYNRVKRAFKVFTINASIIAGLLWGLFMVFPGFFLKIMISDEEIIRIGIPYFRILFSSFLFIGLSNNSTLYFQALGKGWKASLVYLFRQILFFIPLLLILPQFFNVQGVWMAMPAAEILTIFVILILLRKESRNLSVKRGNLLDHA